jgi:hypothetical protein
MDLLGTFNVGFKAVINGKEIEASRYTMRDYAEIAAYISDNTYKVIDADINMDKNLKAEAKAAVKVNIGDVYNFILNDTMGITMGVFYALKRKNELKFEDVSDIPITLEEARDIVYSAIGVSKVKDELASDEDKTPKDGEKKIEVKAEEEEQAQTSSR